MKTVYESTNDDRFSNELSTYLKYFYLIPEPRTQTPNRSLRDDGDPGAGGVGGLTVDGTQAAMVQHRRRAGTAGAAQAHPAPLHPTAAALQTEQVRRPRQLSRASPSPLG